MKDHSNKDKTLSNKKRNQCGQCKHWMTDNCSYLDDAKKGILKRTDDACPDFLSKMSKTWEIVKHPYFFAYVLNDLEQKVKRDIPTKCTTLITCLSAYLSDPLNSALRGIPGVGKSFNVVTVADYFPPEDVMFLLGSSPKALMLEKGVLLDKDGNPISFSEKPEKPGKGQFPKGDEGSLQFEEAQKEYKRRLNEWNERIAESYTFISLQHRIIVFLETPPEETLRMLYPILSHDVKRVEYKTVKEMTTFRVVIEGFPAVLFLQASGTSRTVHGRVYQESYMEEFVTRCLTVSPESSQSKIADANELTNVKASTPWEYETEKESTRIIKEAIVLIRDKFLSENFDVAVPFKNLHELYPRETVGDMRGFQHFIRVLKTFTAFHLFQRPILKRDGNFYVLCSIDDVITVASIYTFIFEQVRTGMEETLLTFYNDIVRKGTEWRVKALMEQYNAAHPKNKKSSDTIRLWMVRLSEIGYVNIGRDEKDKRKNIYDPLVSEAEKPEIVRKLENQPILRSKLEESFEEWLIENGRETEFYQYQFSSGNEELSPIELETVRHDIVKNSFENVPLFLQSVYKQLGVLKPEKQIEESRKEENQTISDIFRKCDSCGYEIEDKGERVGDFIICSDCLHDFHIRGYGDDDIIRDVGDRKSIRERNRAMPKTPKHRSAAPTDSGVHQKKGV